MDEELAFWQADVTDVDRRRSSTQPPTDLECVPFQPSFVDGDFQQGKTLTVATVDENAPGQRTVQLAGDQFKTRPARGEQVLVLSRREQSQRRQQCDDLLLRDLETTADTVPRQTAEP